MPTQQSGIRYARSFLTPTGAAEVEAELDFQLGSDDGIRIYSVNGYGQFYDGSPAVSDTVPAPVIAHQTLHLETGPTEDLPDVAGDDVVDIDSEIFYVMHWSQMFIVGSTVTFGAGGFQVVTPSGLWIPRDPIDTPRNITHKATTISTDTFLNAGVIIEYAYIRFSRQELGAFFARQG